MLKQLLICIISNTSPSYLIFSLDWIGLVFKIFPSEISFDKSSRIISDSVWLLVDPRRKNALTNVLGVVIHDNILWLGHNIMSFSLSHRCCINVFKLFVKLLSTLRMSLELIPNICMLCSKRIERSIKNLLIMNVEWLWIDWAVYFRDVFQLHVIHCISYATLIYHAIGIRSILVWAIIHETNRTLHQF